MGQEELNDIRESTMGGREAWYAGLLQASLGQQTTVADGGGPSSV